MEGAAQYTAFYRKNPHLFAQHYLHLRLKLFQKILLIMMNFCITTVFIGARGEIYKHGFVGYNQPLYTNSNCLAA